MLSDAGGLRLKQDRARRTRHDILLAAANAFNRFGFTAARLDDIGRDARVTKGALYFHFPSKADLAKSVVLAHFTKWVELREEIAALGLDPLTTVVAVSFAVARDYRTNVIARAGVRLSNEYQLVDIELPGPFVSWISGLRTLLEQAQSQQIVRPSLDPEAVANVMVGSYVGIQEVSARLTDGKDLMRRLRDWWALVLPAVTGDAEQAAAILGRINERGQIRRSPAR